MTAPLLRLLVFPILRLLLCLRLLLLLLLLLPLLLFTYLWQFHDQSLNGPQSSQLLRASQQHHARSTLLIAIIVIDTITKESCWLLSIISGSGSRHSWWKGCS